jgi:acyl-CoA thioester hydrolase
MKKHIVNQEVRFADIDSMGHVNNAVFLNYFEQARISFFNDALDIKWDWSHQGVILAKNELEYHSPVMLEDQIHTVIGCESLGTKSFTLVYEIYAKRNGKEELCCRGKSVMVCFDYNQQKSIEIPELWRDKMQEN